MGSAWAGNTVNCVPFRTNAVSTHGSSRYATYYDDAGDVIVSRHDLATNLVHSQRIANERKPYDAHQAISTAFDAQGRFHLAFGAHNSSILTTRSRSKDLSTGFKALEERHERATYPMFLELQNGELALLLHRGRHF
ncbi:BNR-4 repeat-containing protein [Streptomyces griseus]|uniref:BNR-4 repeat-containing protein n=1 Tax=Streptomyces griseus TaxID=1911 RepID=UPI0034D57593